MIGPNTVISTAVIGLVAFIGFFFAVSAFADERYEEFMVSGSSMESENIYDGDVLLVDKQESPEVDDVVVFYCEECGAIQVKKIAAQFEDCYWFEGRPGFWYSEQTERFHESVDSRTMYGWLCTEELSMYGPVIQVF